MEYVLEITTNCGLDTKRTRHTTFTSALRTCKKWRQDHEADIYILTRDGKILYEKLAHSESFIARRARDDFDEIAAYAKNSNRIYENSKLFIR